MPGVDGCSADLLEKYGDLLARLGETKQTIAAFAGRMEGIIQARDAVALVATKDKAVQKKIMAAALKKRAQIYEDAIKVALGREVLDARAVKDPRKRILGLITGTVYKGRGGQNSAGNLQNERVRRYVGKLHYELEARGIGHATKRFKDPVFDADVREATTALRQDTDTSKLDPEAVKMAKLMNELDDWSRTEFNNAGGHIPDADDFNGHNDYDGAKLRDSARILGKSDVKLHTDAENYPSFRAWALEKLDHDRTFEEHVEWLNGQMALAKFDVQRITEISQEYGRRIDNFLESVYRHLTTGVQFAHSGVGDPVKPPSGFGGNLANRLSHGKVLHWKDARAASEAQTKFGRGTTFDAFYAVTNRRARGTALMERLGRNPRATINYLIRLLERDAKDRKDPNTLRLIDPHAVTFGKQIDSALAVVDGSIHIHEQNGFTRLSAGVSAWTNLTRSWGISVSAFIGDPFFKALAYNNMGVGFVRSWTMAFSEQLAAVDPTARRATAMATSIALDGDSQYMRLRLAEEQGLPGTVAKLVQFIHKYNGNIYVTDKARATMAMSLQHILWQHRNHGYGGLHPDIGRNLDQYGVTPEEWELWRTIGTGELKDGRGMISPEHLANSGIETFRPVVEPELNQIDKLFVERMKKLANRRMAADEKLVKRQDKILTRLKALRETYAAMKKRVTEEGTAAGRLSKYKVEELGYEIDRLETEHEIFALARSETAEEGVLEVLDRVEEGADVERWRSETSVRDTGEGPKARNIVGRLSDAQTRKAIAFGAKRARLEMKAVEIRKRAQKAKRSDKESLTEIEASELDRTIRAAQALGDEVAGRRLRTDVIDAEVLKAVDANRRDVQRTLLAAKTATESKLRNMLSHMTDMSVISPTASVMRITTQGDPRGTAQRAFLDILFTLRRFSVGAIHVIGRDTVGRFDDVNPWSARSLWNALTNGSGMARVMANYMVGTTITGLMINQTKDLLRGKTPRIPRDYSEAMNMLALAMASGGGYGIYGDFIMGDLRDRYGTSGLDVLLGPGFQGISDIINLTDSLKHFEVKQAQVANLAVSQVPNTFYTKMAMDWMIASYLQESIAPGSLARQEDRMMKRTGQQYMYPRSSRFE